MVCWMACPEFEKNNSVDFVAGKRFGKNESVLELSVDLRNAKKT